MITVLSPAWSSIGDEAGFFMNARVNSQNVRGYAPRGQQPNFDYAVPESRERFNIWVRLCGNGELIGPVFFDRSVSGPPYLQMLNEEVLPQLLKTFGNHFRDGKFRSLCWTQDGAPAHRSVDARDCLLEFFGMATKVPWLNPMRLFFMGLFKIEGIYNPSSKQWWPGTKHKAGNCHPQNGPRAARDKEGRWVEGKYTIGQ